MKNIFRKIFFCGLAVIFIITLTACGKSGGSSSTNNRGDNVIDNGSGSNDAQSTSDQTLDDGKTASEKLLKTAQNTLDELKKNNFTVEITERGESVTYQYCGNAVKVGDDYYLEEDSKYYHYYLVGEEYHRIEDDEFSRIYTEEWRVFEKTASEIEVNLVYCMGIGYYSDNCFVVEADSKKMVFSNIATTTFSVPLEYIQDIKYSSAEKAIIELLDKIKTPNYSVIYKSDDKVIQYMVAGNMTKIGEVIYEKTDDNTYEYTYDKFLKKYRRTTSLPNVEFDFSDSKYIGKEETYYCVEINGTRYTARTYDSSVVSIAFVNEHENIRVSQIGSVAFEKLEFIDMDVDISILDENGKRNTQYIVSLLSDWLAGYNKFDETLYRAKGITSRFLNRIEFIDFNEDGFCIYVTSKLETEDLYDLRKIYFADKPEFEEKVLAATTVKELVEAFNSLEIKDKNIKMVNLVEFDSNHGFGEARARAANVLAKAGLTSNVLFAVETDILGEGNVAFPEGSASYYNVYAFLDDGCFYSFKTLCSSKDRVTENDVDNFSWKDLTIITTLDDGMILYQQNLLNAEGE